MQRVFRGLDKVDATLKPGAKVSDLNAAFLAEMDHDKDVLYGDVVHHTGYEGHEASVPLDVVQPHDYLTTGVVVHGDGETAIVYRGSKWMDPSDKYRGAGVAVEEDPPMAPAEAKTGFRGSSVPFNYMMCVYD